MIGHGRDEMGRGSSCKAYVEYVPDQREPLYEVVRQDWIVPALANAQDRIGDTWT